MRAVVQAFALIAVVVAALSRRVHHRGVGSTGEQRRKSACLSHSAGVCRPVLNDRLRELA